jgi:hypothetical protein
LFFFGRMIERKKFASEERIVAILPGANQEQTMRHDLDLVMERESVLKGLFEATFGRLFAVAAGIGRVIFRLGTVDRPPNED